MAPLVEMTDVEAGSGLNALLVRARAALQVLGDGKVRTANGIESVKELQERLNELAGLTGMDLREVQESIVEHAAMYANCPEVLGGMLQLVFCLDTVRDWLEQRDRAMQDTLSQLDTLQRNFEDCTNHITELGVEVRNCTKLASTLEGAVVTQPALVVPSPHLTRAAAAPPKSPQRRQEHVISVDLQALEADAENDKLVVELRHENKDLWSQCSELHRRLAQADAEVAAARQDKAAACSAAEAARSAAEQTAAAAEEAVAMRGQSSPAACSREMQLQQQRHEPSALGVLEQLEPLLAGLPVGVVPGMSELQEEACEVYGRLRSLLITAAAGVPAAGFPEQLSPPATSLEFSAREPLPLSLPVSARQVPAAESFARYPQAPPAYTMDRLSYHHHHAPSATTSEDRFDMWRTVPTAVISDPLRGIGPNTSNWSQHEQFARMAPMLVHENTGGLRLNRLS